MAKIIKQYHFLNTETSFVLKFRSNNLAYAMKTNLQSNFKWGNELGSKYHAWRHFLI